MRAARKGQFELSMLTIEVTIIVIGLMVLYSIINTFWQPHRQIAFANAELLRMAIDDVCVGGGAKTIDFNFPQPKPITFGYFGMGPMPKLMVKTNGDPNYILYYENFPPGEAYNWEVYMTQPQRAINFLLNKDFSDYTQEIPFTTANVVLGQNETFGNWSRENPDYFKFSNYVALPDLNKSMAKYRFCGTNALCLKTKDGIYRMPLPHCKGKIEDIQLLQKWGSLEDEDEQFDFYIASPCSAKLKVEKTRCGCGEWGSEAEDDTGPGKPTQVFEIPIFERTTTGLSELGRTKRCFHRIGEAGKEAADEVSFHCIKISIEGGKDFCFSTNDVEATFGRDVRVITETSKLGRLPWIWSVYLVGNAPGKEAVVFTSYFLEWLNSAGTLSWAWPSAMAFE